MSCGKPSSWPSSRSLRKRSPMAAIINRVCLMTEKCQHQFRVPQAYYQLRRSRLRPACVPRHQRAGPRAVQFYVVPACDLPDQKKIQHLQAPATAVMRPPGKRRSLLQPA